MGYYDQMNRSGRNIMDYVTEAISSNDYSNLSKNVQVEVIDLTRELQNYYRLQQQQTMQQRPDTMRPGMYRQQIESSHGTPFNRTSPRYANSLFKRMFGMAAAAGICCLGVGMASFFSLFGGLQMIGVELVVLLIAFFFSIKLYRDGSREKSLLDKFYKYARLCGNEDYISIRKLAKVAGETEQDVVKAIEQMINRKYLPYAKFDAAKRTLMLSDEVYQEYLKKEDEKIADEQAAADKEAGIENLNASEDVKRIIREGQKFIDYIAAANEKIPDAAMTGKLSKLQLVVEKIFEQVREKPASAGDLNKLMTYYLPTTRKLIDAYIDLDRQTLSSRNIEDTKKEIEGALDTVNDAFETLFDSLFQDVAWDISSEVSAMRTMMAQDGLADSKINNIKKADPEGEVRQTR